MSKNKPNQTENPENPKKSILREIISWIVTVAVAIFIALFIVNFIIINSNIASGSMESTIMTGDRLFGNRLAYTFSEPERGDIIIFEYPDDPEQLYVKRIIGLPGETVEIKDGVTYIDGVPLDEPYLNETPTGDFGPYVVPEGCYFVMGDNRNNSNDSRYWVNTYVPEEAIVAKASIIYWPIRNIQYLG